MSENLVTVQLHGLGVFNTLRQLPPELVSKRGGPVRAALRKAAVVIHKQERANLQAAIAHSTDAGERKSTGLLVANLVISRGQAPIGGKGERFLVRVRRKTYPDRTGKPTTTLASAQLLEYGSSKQPAEPWIRPAVSSRGTQALQTFERELGAGVARVVAKLALTNKGK